MPYNPVARSEVIGPSKKLPGITAGVILGVFAFVALIGGLMFLCVRPYTHQEVTHQAGKTSVTGAREAAEEVTVVVPGISPIYLGTYKA